VALTRGGEIDVIAGTTLTSIRVSARLGRLRALSPFAILLIAVAASGCGSQSDAAQKKAPARAPARARVSSSAPIVTGPGQPRGAWQPVASVGGEPAVWIAQRAGITLLRFDQRLVHLALHAGSAEPGGGGWTYGDRIGPNEIHRVVAAFNGGFKLGYGSVGFMANGRTPVPLASGLASIVTYDDGRTEIGAWHQGVPARGLAVASVLQNLHLLVDRSAVAPTVTTCVSACWGITLGGGTDVARSALGITAAGELVWAAGESLSPAMLARGLVGAGVGRAVELDINPEWVAGYLYVHHGSGPTAEPVVPGQSGIPGRLLAPYNRDFFTIHAG
jgi:hypothetical protein